MSPSSGVRSLKNSRPAVPKLVSRSPGAACTVPPKNRNNTAAQESACRDRSMIRVPPLPRRSKPDIVYMLSLLIATTDSDAVRESANQRLQPRAEAAYRSGSSRDDDSRSTASEGIVPAQRRASDGFSGRKLESRRLLESAHPGLLRGTRSHPGAFPEGWRRSEGRHSYRARRRTNRPIPNGLGFPPSGRGLNPPGVIDFQLRNGTFFWGPIPEPGCFLTLAGVRSAWWTTR